MLPIKLLMYAKHRASTCKAVYKQVLREMYQDADPDVKAACEDDARASNDFCKAKPPASEIYA